MFDLGSYWPASDNFAGGGGYPESFACSQYLVFVSIDLNMCLLQLDINTFPFVVFFLYV